MSSGHTVGLQIFVARRSGYSLPQVCKRYKSYTRFRISFHILLLHYISLEFLRFQKLHIFRIDVAGEENYLKAKFGNLIYDINSEDVHDPEKYPDFAKLEKKFIVIQNPGEIIFVPSGWHHQVHNMVNEPICPDLNL